MLILFVIIQRILSKCDIIFDKGLISDGKIITKSNSLPSIQIDQDYDFMQNPKLMKQTGPSIGHSASIKVNDNPLILEDLKSFVNSTIQFDIFISLKEDSLKKQQECIILQKGEYIPNYSYEVNGQPLLTFNKKTKKLKLSRNVYSYGSLIENKWNRITLKIINDTSTLFINGLEDKQYQTVHYEVRQTLYIGEVPWQRCYMNTLIENFKLFNVALTKQEIQSQIKNFQYDILIGCEHCSYQDIVCPDNYHVCKPIELYAGVYSKARNSGWIQWDTSLWLYKNKTVVKDRFRFSQIVDEPFQNQEKIYISKPQKIKDLFKLDMDSEDVNQGYIDDHEFHQQDKNNEDIPKQSNEDISNNHQIQKQNTEDISQNHQISKTKTEDISKTNDQMIKKTISDKINNQTIKIQNQDNQNFTIESENQNNTILRIKKKRNIVDNENNLLKSQLPFGKSSDDKENHYWVNLDELIYFKTEQGNSKFREKRLERYNATAICCPDQ